MSRENIIVGDSIIYAEISEQSIRGVVTEYDPYRNTVKLTDVDGEYKVHLEQVFWYIVNPTHENHP